MSEERKSHRGTIALTIAFLVLVVAMWAWTYFTLIDRG